MKKFLAMILALVMVLSLAACGGSGDGESSGSPSTQPSASQGVQETETPPPVDAEPITFEPLVHLDFETTDGLTAVRQVENDGSVHKSAPNMIVKSNHPITLAEGQGAVGNALYLDGKYGVDFDVPEIEDDVYTISFWYNADRVSNFGPVVQMGRNIAWSNVNISEEPRDRTVTWINFTKTDWVEEVMPVVWNKNTSVSVSDINPDGVNPWTCAYDETVHGKKEWCLVTLVVDGDRYVCADDGMDRIGSSLYINGELVHQANSDNLWYQGMAPEIFKGDNREGHIGINYWDVVFKGFIDELYIFGDALTAGMVKTLYEQGNPPATPVAPETPAYEEEGAAADSSTLTVGGFFSNKTDFTALKNGETLTYTFTNTSNGSANWENYIMAVVTADANTYDGASQEVMVIRADAWGWGGGASDFVAPDGDGNKLAFEHDIDFDSGEFAAMMKAGCEVKITVTLNGNTLTYNATLGEKTVSMTATSGVDLPDTLYVFLTGENCKLANIAVA